MTALEQFQKSLSDVGIDLKGISAGSDPTVTPQQIAAEIQRSLTVASSPLAQWFMTQQAKGLVNLNVSFFDTEGGIDVTKAVSDLMQAEAAIEAGHLREPPQPKNDIPVEVMQVLKESKLSK